MLEHSPLYQSLCYVLDMMIEGQIVHFSGLFWERCFIAAKISVGWIVDVGGCHYRVKSPLLLHCVHFVCMCVYLCTVFECVCMHLCVCACFYLYTCMWGMHVCDKQRRLAKQCLSLGFVWPCH